MLRTGSHCKHSYSSVNWQHKQIKSIFLKYLHQGNNCRELASSDSCVVLKGISNNILQNFLPGFSSCSGCILSHLLLQEQSAAYSVPCRECWMIDCAEFCKFSNNNAARIPCAYVCCIKLQSKLYLLQSESRGASNVPRSSNKILQEKKNDLWRFSVLFFFFFFFGGGSVIQRAGSWSRTKTRGSNLHLNYYNAPPCVAVWATASLRILQKLFHCLPLSLSLGDIYRFTRKEKLSWETQVINTSSVALMGKLFRELRWFMYLFFCVTAR